MTQKTIAKIFKYKSDLPKKGLSSNTYFNKLTSTIPINYQHLRKNNRKEIKSLISDYVKIMKEQPSLFIFDNVDNFINFEI